uniref:Reverse transcriptase zinc-binding domain-containing protein n=1 Tax=Cannabis sativa TaxID=3483 RepID=A0A803QY08_CANSA
MPLFIFIPWLCVCCKRSEEDVDHLFLDCCFICILWFKLLEEFELCWVFPGSIKQMILSKVVGCRCKTKLWRTAILATF